MQSGDKSQTPWPMLAPMMAWSPQVWLGALFGRCEQEGQQRVAQVAAPVQAVQSVMDSAMRGSSGWLKANAETGSEIAALVNRRSQSYVGLAADLGKCRTPVDVVGVQMKFMQLAMQHHTEAARRITQAWSALLPMAPAAAAYNSSSIIPPRDRITFSEPKEMAAATAARGGSADRRSAA